MLATLLDSRGGLVDALLLEIAKRIQLSPTDYGLAVDRYQTIDRYLGREGNPLAGLVTRLYPQGSMAIGSVISSKFENDEFDIDIIAELAIPANTPPSQVLDALFHALNGEKGSRYHGKVERCSRCVKVQYENMHLDVTPAVLLAGMPERTSLIFHANEKQSAGQHYTVTANPWGFAEWFKEQMPEVAMYMNAMDERVAEPVPDLESLNEKAKPLVALQLLKRWRNKVYDQREGRMPPSVMLSCLIAHNSGYRKNLFDELVSQAQYLHQYFDAHTREGVLVEVENPACKGRDVFTDRWPGTIEAQRQFTKDLKQLNDQLAWLAQHRTVEGCKQVMGELFGERPTTYALDSLAEHYGTKANAGELRHHAGSGAVAVGASGLLAGLSSAPSYATPRTTNFGED